VRGPAIKPIVIAAGGTGGHFFPAEALAARLIARGHRVVLMTDARSGAGRSQVFAGHEQHVLHGAGIAGRGFARGVTAVAGLAAGTAQARVLLKNLDAGVIVAFGGYPAVAPVLAARTLRRRPAIILQEQNAVLGRANRLFARVADMLALGFAQTRGVPRAAATLVTGNPVRPAIAALAGQRYTPPADSIELLVLGGSLGARVFSDIMPPSIALLPHALRARLRITQQCRPEDLVRVGDAYEAIGVPATVSTFFGNVAELLAAAHLVIARAGASTCAELAAIGRPSILVPLPGAIDNHQAANAASLAAAGAALVLPQAGLTPASLAARLQICLAEPWLMATAAAAAASSRVGAADDLADLVETHLARAEARP
jgi:UDP-N-acetylglucosamine--N-acetylmuramyl-(pentapeptide) pyrophosphoryl-undecaprenol N-acetylglucosamine transferase